MIYWREGVEYIFGDMKVMEEVVSYLYNVLVIVYLILFKNFLLWLLYDLGGFGMGMIIVVID